jgi:hypothetical protein
MRPPEVYAAINAVSAELARAGLPKQNFNLQDDYFYRSIDDVMNRLAPLLALHRLCVLPRAVERNAIDRAGLNNAVLSHVTLKVAFDLISVEDGSCHTVQSFGEALDESDKATAKAMSAAYKSAMLQSFCVPIIGEDDPDRGKLVPRQNHGPAPVQGWDQWSKDVIEMIRVCQSEAALTRVQTTNRAMLQAIQRERRELYDTIGVEFAARRRAITAGLAGAGSKKVAGSAEAPSPRRSREKSAKAEEPQHA